MTINLEGVWELVTHLHQKDDGSIIYPYGERPVGRLVYSKSGHMLVAIMRTDRKRFASAGLFSGSDAEKAAAVNGFLSYSGTYRVVGDKVFHDVDVSLFPNWVGTVQERNIKLDGDSLTLSSNPLTNKSGRIETAIITWRRVFPDRR